MNKSDFVKQLAARQTQWNESQVAAAADKVFKHIVEQVRQDNNVEIRGFGTFFAQPHRTRHLRNPRTKALIEIPAKRIPRFKAGKKLGKMANAAQAASATNKSSETFTSAD